MILVNVPLQSSKSNLVTGEIIQMHTILESNCTAIKLPRNRNFKAKKTKCNWAYRNSIKRN